MQNSKQDPEETFLCLSNNRLWSNILNDENKRLYEEIQHLSQANQTLSMANQGLSEANKTLYMANQRLYEEVGKLNNQGDRILEELEKRHANYKEQLKKMTDYIAMLEEINIELKETIERLRTQNKDLFYDRN